MTPASPESTPPPRDLRPLVRRDGPTTLVVPALFLIVAAAGILLFVALRSPRTPARPATDVSVRDGETAFAHTPPPLRLPPEPRATDPAKPPAPPAPPPAPMAPAPSTPPPPVAPRPAPPASTGRDASQLYLPGAAAPARAGNASEQALVIDVTQADPAAAGGNDAAAAAPAGRASRLRNRATLIAAGTLIPAVLESALDTSQPGYARALVSQDVAGFDATRILIPRGSRLIGEYRSDLAAGQRRALLTWTRLIRPDGVSVTLAAPATDALGRTGVRGKVNTHAWARFGDAVLRSVLDIGVNVASARIGNAPVIVGLPGSVGGNVGQAVGGRTVAPPTVTVPPGAVVSVFVNRDLDFSRVELRR